MAPTAQLATKPSSDSLKKFKESSKTWSQERLADESTVILDLESTGLLSQDPETEIAQVCILDIHVVLSSRCCSNLRNPCVRR